MLRCFDASVAALRRTCVLALTAADWLLSKALAHARASPSSRSARSKGSCSSTTSQLRRPARQPLARACSRVAPPCIAWRPLHVGWLVRAARSRRHGSCHSWLCGALSPSSCSAEKARRSPAAHRGSQCSVAEPQPSPVRLWQMPSPGAAVAGASPVRLRQVCAELRVLSSPIRGVQWVR